MKVDPFEMSAQEEELRRALFRWRDEVAKTQYLEYEQYGGDILLHHLVIDRIVGLAHEKKIRTVEELRTQTGWCFAPRYGAVVLEIIHKHCPPVTVSALFTNAPLSRSTGVNSGSAQTAASGKRTRASPTCSVCGQLGHRSE